MTIATIIRLVLNGGAAGSFWKICKESTANTIGATIELRAFWPLASARAVELVLEPEFGTMTAFRPPDLVPVALERVVGRIRTVPRDFDVIRAARAMGIGFGDCAAA